MSLADSGRAIGAVTRLLQDHLVRRGFDVSVGKPEDAASNDTNAKLNLFLYETAFDAALRNHALRDSEPAPLWLVLKYLLTAFDSTESSDTAAAHDLLGRGVSALHELNYLRLDPLVALPVRLALEHNPEPLKLSFDESNVDLLSKIMQGTDERYRMSVAFQVRPVMIVPGVLPRSALLVGIDYTSAPNSVIGRDGVHIDVVPSLGAKLDRIEPDRFEAGEALIVFGEDIAGSDIEFVLGNVRLQVVERRVDRVVLAAEGSPGTPIASGATLSAGELPLVAQRRLSPTRVRSSNLVAARLLPTLSSAAIVAGDLVLDGVLLGNDTDDIVVALMRASDGRVVRQFDTFTPGAGQQTLTITGAAAAVPVGAYRVILYVNSQQAKSSPLVNVV